MGALVPLLLVVALAAAASGGGSRRRKGPTTFIEFEDPDTVVGDTEDPGVLPDPTFDPSVMPVDSVVLPKDGPPLPPVAEGVEGDPVIADWHAQMNAYFASMGVLDQATAEEVTFLPKATEIDFAVPDPRYWENMVVTLLMLKETNLRDRDLDLRGYRPAWYNEATGGSDNSTHQWFSALDIRPRGNTSMGEIFDAAQWLWDNRSRDANMGIGVYNNNIHIDARRPEGRAKWGSRKDIL